MAVEVVSDVWRVAAAEHGGQEEHSQIRPLVVLAVIVASYEGYEQDDLIHRLFAMAGHEYHVASKTQIGSEAKAVPFAFRLLLGVSLARCLHQCLADCLRGMLDEPVLESVLHVCSKQERAHVV